MLNTVAKRTQHSFLHLVSKEMLDHVEDDIWRKLNFVQFHQILGLYSRDKTAILLYKQK